VAPFVAFSVLVTAGPVSFESLPVLELEPEPEHAASW